MMNNKELNELIAEKIFGWIKNPEGVRCHGCWLTDVRTVVTEVPDYIGNISSAWKIVEKLQVLVCKFKTADGYVILQNGEWGDHSTSGFCDLTGNYSDEELNLEDDPQSWSFHIHLGLLSEDSKVPKHWHHGDAFCHRAGSPTEAICIAALKAYGVTNVI